MRTNEANYIVYTDEKDTEYNPNGGGNTSITIINPVQIEDEPAFELPMTANEIKTALFAGQLIAIYFPITEDYTSWADFSYIINLQYSEDGQGYVVAGQNMVWNFSSLDEKPNMAFD